MTTQTAPEDTREAMYARVVHLDPDKIQDNPWQPRGSIDTEGLRELAESIHEQGLLQPPVARFTEEFGDQAQLAFGHRRVAAIRLLISERRWSGGIPVSVQDLTDADMVLMALAENARRQDLTVLEEIRAYDRALREVKGLKIQHLANSIGMSRSALSNLLRLLNLPDVVLDRIDSGKLSPAAARVFLVLVNDDHRHDQEIEYAVEDLAGYERRQTWRVEDVQSAIRRAVRKFAGTRWRPMTGPSEKYYESYGVEGKSPAFDVEQFRKDNPKRLHKIPREKGSREWTCAGGKWERLQREATRDDEKSEDARALKRWGAILKQDALFKSVMNGTVPRETDDGLIDLTPEQKEQLGTRAELKTEWDHSEFMEPVHRGAWNRTLPLLADIEECRERCTIGAQYIQRHPTDPPRLYCLNEKHYLEKLAQGEWEWKERANIQRQRTDQEDVVMVKSLVNGLSEPLARALALTMLSRFPFSKVNPDEDDNWQTRVFSYIPQTLVEVAEVLELEIDDSNNWRCFDQKAATEAVKDLNGPGMRQVAARLITHAIRGGVGPLEFSEIVGAIEGSG